MNDPAAIDPDFHELDLAAFGRTEVHRNAMPRENLPRYTLDARYAMEKATQTARRLAPFRDAIAGLSGFDISHLDRLLDLARGLRWTHTEATRRVQLLKEVPELAEEGYPLRALMLAHLETWSLKRVVSPELVARIREGSGHRDLAADLDVCVYELRALPAEVRTGAVTEADLKRASAIANSMIEKLGLTEVDLSQEALIEARNKLGALLLQSQAQLRRAMEYLRFAEGDAAEMVPSLHVPGGRPPGKATDPMAELSAVHDHLHEDPAAPVPPKDPNDNPFGA